MGSRTVEKRSMQAAQKRQEREARKRQKDLEKRLKERAKLSAMEQARLEVEAFENALEILLSVHKEQSAPIDWARFLLAHAPHRPWQAGRHEFAEALKHGIAEIEGISTSGRPAERARVLDESEFLAIADDYSVRHAEWERMRLLARRVLAGESGAYSEVISEFSSFADVAGLGSSLHVAVHSPQLVECTLTVNGREVVPSEVKSLTAAGKLSTKAMPKQRFHEVYQDYVCGCVLRVAREMLALLPVETVLVTASATGIDARTGNQAPLPVLSVAFPRAVVARLDFERLDPSESMENFVHRGDVKASRKSGAFLPVAPLTPSDLASPTPTQMDLSGLLLQLRTLRAEISVTLAPAPIPDEASTDDPTLS